MTTYATNAKQWAWISQYGYSHQNYQKIWFTGPLDEHGDYPNTNTSQQAWDQLWGEVNNGTLHPGLGVSFDYSSEIWKVYACPGYPGC